MSAFLSVADIADKLGVSQSLVRRWIRQQRLPAVRLGALRAIRVAEADLAAFIEKRPARKSTS